jgi:hypothetical protein
MSKKGEAHLHNVAMLALGVTILLMSVGTRDLMGDANVAEKIIKPLIFPTPIRLNYNNFAIKTMLNKSLELKEILEHLRSGTKQINLNEFNIIIYEADIIFLGTKRINRSTPHIQKISSKGADGRLEDT